MGTNAAAKLGRSGPIPYFGLNPSAMAGPIIVSGAS
jgi:hypothetical protein